MKEGDPWWLGNKDSHVQSWNPWLGGGSLLTDDLMMEFRDGWVWDTFAGHYQLGVWQHLVWVEVSDHEHRLYLNGAQVGADFFDHIPVGVNRLSVGRSGALSSTFYFSGDLAMLTIWDLALTPAEIVIAAQSPMSVQPNAVVSHYVLGGNNSPEPDSMGGPALEVFGATKSLTGPLPRCNPGWQRKGRC